MSLKKIFIILFIFYSFQFFNYNSFSVEPDEILQDQKLELRARNISKKIRCMVCQNQSIDDSVAPLAKDLRVLIRSKILQGYSDDEIFVYLTDRYGDYILLKPPFKLSTLALWSLPFVFFMIGIFVIFFHNKKSKKEYLFLIFLCSLRILIFIASVLYFIKKIINE